QSNAVNELSSKVILLDRALAFYGPQTKEARELLRRAVVRTLDRIWPNEAGTADLAPGEARAELELFYGKVAGLSPDKDDTRRTTLKARALDFTTEMVQTRLRLFAQRDGSIPLPFVVVLVVWLVVLFVGYGLTAPRNATVLAVQVLCILSVSGALFL